MAPLVGLPPPALLGLLDGYSPVSGVVDPDAAEALAALREDPQAAAILSAGGDPADRLAELRRQLTEVDEYVGHVGCRLIDGFDLNYPTLIERPDLILGKLAAALDPTHDDARDRADAMADDLRRRLPADCLDMFNELLADARALYRLRDERGLYSDVCAIGLLRLAALEAGRRLVTQGRLHAEEHSFDAVVEELHALLSSTKGPSANELRDRAAARSSRTGAPRFIGGQPRKPPPLDGFPDPLVTVMSAMGIASEGVLGELPEPVGDEQLVGGICGNPGIYEGPVRRISSADDLFSIEPGDVLVTQTTGEAFNGIIHLVGAIVTDHGSFASHAAIVAREMGFPAVVGTVDGTSRLREGDMVRVDGGEGTVIVLK